MREFKILILGHSSLYESHKLLQKYCGEGNGEDLIINRNNIEVHCAKIQYRRYIKGIVMYNN